MTRTARIRIALGLMLLVAAAPVQASATSGLGAILIGGFAVGLLVAAGLGWALSRLSRDPAIRRLIIGVAVGAYLVWLAAFILGF